MEASKRMLIMPGQVRYQPSALQQFFGYDNTYCGLAEVELATLDELATIGVIPASDHALLTDDHRHRILTIPATEVDLREREVTKHDVRAWVQLAQMIIPESLRKWMHVPLTSYDGLDTGRSVQYVRAQQHAVDPASRLVIGHFADLVLRFADTLQIGRTHGQHALPITVGFWLATILSRILYNAKQMELYADGLVGKISGAVGAYNAQEGLQVAERCGSKSFEDRVLERLSIRPAQISTQILPPEPLAYYLFATTMLTAAFGQFGRDFRQLMRSEIGEVCEPFGAKQVGSSTMAHKRNPINSENTEGMFWRTKNEFGKVLDTLISEHQRDLVGSCVARDFPIIIINLCKQLDTLLRKDKEGQKTYLERLRVNEDACMRNFRMSADVVIAEPLYIALAMAGYPGDAHDLVNHRAMPIALEQGINLLDAVEILAENDEDIAMAVAQVPEKVLSLLRTPGQYIGHAPQKAREIVDEAKAYITAA